jgi:LacI family transcriptional regulator
MKQALSVDMDVLAERLGVSKTTVHYALHNSGRISEPMRKRVLDLAKKLNYRPNLLARGLRSKRTAMIGVVAAHLSTSFHAKLVEAIEDAARVCGRSILLACSYANAQREREAVELLLDKGVDGLIVAPAESGPASADFYRRLLKEGKALVFVDRHIPEVNVASVATDHESGGYMAGRHLLRLGRRRFAVSLPSLGESRPTSLSGRVGGLNRGLREAGLPAAIEIGPESLDHSPEGAHRAFQRFFSVRGKRIDAVFAANDGLAYGAVRAILEHGASVPGDIAVVGFDDQDPSAYFHPPLTTIRQPVRDIGTEAVRLLVRQIDEPDKPAGQQILLEGALIVRESCGEMAVR